MAELVNCEVCRQTFHDSPKKHDCKGCGGKIHVSILHLKCSKVVDHEEDNWCSNHCLRKNWSYREDCPVLITTDPDIIGTVGVVGSGGEVSTVVVLQDELEKGDQGEHDFVNGDDEDEDTDHIDHTKLTKDVVYPERQAYVRVCVQDLR